VINAVPQTVVVAGITEVEVTVLVTVCGFPPTSTTAVEVLITVEVPVIAGMMLVNVAVLVTVTAAAVFVEVASTDAVAVFVEVTVEVVRDVAVTVFGTT
jgi:hypothetical protein